MAIRNVAVIGAGLMGHGIAQVMAQTAGYEVYLKDVKQEFLDNGMGRIKWSLGKLVEKEKMSQTDADSVFGKIHPTLDMKTAVGEADFVIEAVPEKLELKHQIFKELDSLAPKDTVLTTNTSSISISRIAEVTKRPGMICGMHFFNPVQMMRLVEIIHGDQTADETINIVKQVSHKMGKETVIVKKDSPGFIVNRVLIPALNEAIYLIHEGVADPEDIDKAIKLGLNWPMGPFEFADYIGIDNVLATLETASQDGAQYLPCRLLRQMATAGQLGRKTGKGFYTYK